MFAKEQQLVITGNAHLNMTRRLLRFVISHKIPVPLNKPLNSRLWWTPAMKPLMARAQLTRVYFCQYGTRWKKPTRLATWSASLEALE